VPHLTPKSINFTHKAQKMSCGFYQQLHGFQSKSAFNTKQMPKKGYFIDYP
jgi:hypothetical protein